MNFFNIMGIILLWILIIAACLLLLLITLILIVRVSFYIRINNNELILRLKIFGIKIYDSKSEINKKSTDISEKILDKISKKVSEKNKNKDKNIDNKENIPKENIPKENINSENINSNLNEKENTDNNKVADSGNDIKNDKSDAEESDENNEFTKEKIFDIIKKGFYLLKKAAGRFRRSIIVNKLYFNFLIATGDAAKTAVLFGGACSLYYPFLEYIKSKIKIKDDFTNICVGYDTKEVKFDITLEAAMHGAGAIYIMMPALIFYLKYKRSQKKTQKQKNE